MSEQRGTTVAFMKLAAAILAVTSIEACGPGAGSGPSTVPTAPSPAATPAQPVLITSFVLAPVNGTVKARDLQWHLELRVNEPLPGLFVRVDLETGIYNRGEACYASEFSQTTALDPQAGLSVSTTGFVWSPRSDSRCAGPQFKPVDAFIRVFNTSDSYARTPVASGVFNVGVTVVE